MMVCLFIIRFILFHAFQQPGEIIEVARVNIQVEQVAVAVEEFVGGEGIDTKVALDGGLLVVKIPAGTKNVELRYRAKGQVAGTLLSISAFVFCASAIAATLIKKRRMRLDAGALNDPEPVDFK